MVQYNHKTMKNTSTEKKQNDGDRSEKNSLHYSTNTRSVFVAISGGVDSAVAAALLIDKGYPVTGVFMKNWSGEEYGVEDECPWKEDQNMAELVCKHLGIPFKTYNFEEEYRTAIISTFFNEYRAGRTPNPDILCNKDIKFGSFLERAVEEGADYIATGHYADLHENEDGSLDLVRAMDTSKDQTYFLSSLRQDQLMKTLFPLGKLKKSEVRKIAKERNFPNANRKDSQGICFLGKIDVREFLEKEIPSKTGDILDADTKEIIGRHQGVWYFTLGQREGIGVGGAGEPYFVCDKDVLSNTLYVAKGKENPRLYTQQIILDSIHTINNPIPEKTQLTCQLRYRQDPVPCMIEGKILKLEKPIWKPSPGQTAVFLRNNVILGNSVIEKVE